MRIEYKCEQEESYISFDMHTHAGMHTLQFSLLQEGGSGKQLYNKLKDHKICSSKDNQPLHSMVTIATHWFLKIKKSLSLLHFLDTMLNCLNKRRQIQLFFIYQGFFFLREKEYLRICILLQSLAHIQIKVRQVYFVMQQLCAIALICP